MGRTNILIGSLISFLVIFYSCGLLALYTLQHYNITIAFILMAIICLTNTIMVLFYLLDDWKEEK